MFITYSMTINFVTTFCLRVFCAQVIYHAVRGADVWFLILPSHAHGARLRCWSLWGLSCSLGAQSHGAHAGEGERAAGAERQDRSEPQHTLSPVRFWLVWCADGRPKLPRGEEDRMWKLRGAETWYALSLCQTSTTSSTTHYPRKPDSFLIAGSRSIIYGVAIPVFDT